MSTNTRLIISYIYENVFAINVDKNHLKFVSVNYLNNETLKKNLSYVRKVSYIIMKFC